MEAYVDDMIMKSLLKKDHIRDLKESFDAVRHHQIELNPTKYAFGATSGKFFRFLVTLKPTPKRFRPSEAWDTLLVRRKCNNWQEESLL